MHTLTLGLTILFFCTLAFGSERGANQIKNTLKRGTELERQGRYFRASTNYLVASPRGRVPLCQIEIRGETRRAT